jgi:LCP family protein required for cell wall assembly
MAAGGTRGAVAGALSLAVPGAGQLYVGARRRGLVLLALTALLLLGTVAALAWWTPDVDRRLVAVVLGLDVALLALRLFAVADAAALTAAPHVAAAYVAVRGYGVLEEVFADEEPTDVLAHDGVFLRGAPRLPRYVAPDTWSYGLAQQLPAAEPLDASPEVLVDEPAADTLPWTTILLLGTDEGPGNWGARTDTMILAALQHGTGRAAAFGIPRNLVEVPLGDGRGSYAEPLNALYGYGRVHPELWEGDNPGASALKQAVSLLLGVRVDYYALVNLRGFADLVDALGGVEIRVKERLVDEVTRPAWGEPKPRIDVRPGEVRRFYGREALAYVRSRKTSNDYARMARQRCFLSALAEQVDPVRVLRSFGSLAKTVETSVSTDIPLARLPSLVRLAAAVDSARTLTVTFGPDYFASRRPADNFPLPDVEAMHELVRQAIVAPDELQAAGQAQTAKATC